MQFLAELLDLVDPYQLVSMVLMGHVDTGNVHAGEHQLPQDGRIVGGGAERTDDFCFSHGGKINPFPKISNRFNRCADGFIMDGTGGIYKRKGERYSQFSNFP